jgi:hypothetical protein
MEESTTCDAVIKISMTNQDLALMVKQCLDVDDELQPARLVKTIVQDGSLLIV